MRYVLLFILLTFGGCQTNIPTSGQYVPGAVSVSSPSFIKAKYLTELTYITKDKELVRQFKKCYAEKKCIDPKFKGLRRWAAGKDRHLILETIELFLKADFQGV